VDVGRNADRDDDVTPPLFYVIDIYTITTNASLGRPPPCCSEPALTEIDRSDVEQPGVGDRVTP